jgi:hypothetical protein
VVMFSLKLLGAPMFSGKFIIIRRMPSSGMLRHVALVINDISEDCRELSTSIITVTTIGKLRTTLTVTSNQFCHYLSLMQLYLLTCDIHSTTTTRECTSIELNIDVNIITMTNIRLHIKII